METIYIVTDIESDGPVPGINSMLSFASVAVDSTGKSIGEYTANLLPIPGHVQNEATMKWWKTQPSFVWESVNENSRDGSVVMPEFADWVSSFGGQPVITAHPIEFDGPWMRWYCHKFLGKDIFWRTGLDLRSFAAAILAWDIPSCTRAKYPKELHDDAQHSHEALSDAREYAAFLSRMIQRLPEKKLLAV